MKKWFCTVYKDEELGIETDIYQGMIDKIPSYFSSKTINNNDAEISQLGNENAEKINNWQQQSVSNEARNSSNSNINSQAKKKSIPQAQNNIAADESIAKTVSDNSVYKLQPEYLTIDFNYDMIATIVTHNENSFKVSGNFRTGSDFGGLIWNTVDEFDHPTYKYAENNDFSNVVLSYNYSMSGDIQSMDSGKAPTITVITTDGLTYYVRLWNYVVEGSTGNEGSVVIDFNNLYAGWSPDIEWTKIDPSKIKKLIWSLTPNEYGDQAYLSSSQEFSMEISDWNVTGNTYLCDMPASQASHSIRMTDDFDDEYNVTPERLIDQYTRLGYGGVVDFYIGAAHYYDKSYDGTKITMDTNKVFNAAFASWFEDYASRLAQDGTQLIASVSMENVESPESWWQRTADGSPAETGWTPTPHVLSFTNTEVQTYYKNYVAELASIQQRAGLEPIVQVGEPWWWTNSDGSPCFYDQSTKNLFSSTFGYDMPLFYSTSDSTSGYGGVLEWLSDQMGEFTWMLRDEVKKYSNAKFTVLFFSPSVIDNEKISPMMRIVNVPVQYWQYPNLDFFMLEDYDYLINNEMDKHWLSMKWVQSVLGYSPDQIHYFSGFVLNSQDQSIWKRINQALNDGFSEGFSENYVWAFPQVRDDSWFPPVIITASEGSGNFYNPIYVNLSSNSGNMLIYTVDGSNPTPSDGEIFNESICIEDTTTLKVAVLQNESISDIVTYRYNYSVSQNTDLLKSEYEIDPEESLRYYADPVDTASGAHVIDHTLLAVKGAQTFSFDLHYNSLLLKKGSFGTGWESNYDAALQTDSNGNVTIHWSVNRSNSFVLQNGVYVAQSDADTYNKLVKNNDGSFVFTKDNQSQYVFDSSGKLQEIRNGKGQFLHMTYDESGKLVRITEPVSGQFFSLTYNSNGLVKSVSDNGNQTVELKYNSNQELVQIVKGTGTISYSYVMGQVLTGTDLSGKEIFSDVHDNYGRVVKQYDGENKFTTFSYDDTSTAGIVQTTVKNRDGQTLVYTYDKNYNLLSFVDGSGNKTQYTYDAFGNQISVTSGNNNTSTNTYDSQGNLLTKTDPMGETTTMTYDLQGNILSITSPGGETTTFTYDSKNCKTSTTDALNHTTTYTYDENSLLLEQSDEVRTNTYTYENGRIKTFKSPGQGQTSYSYDFVGRVSVITDSNGNTISFTYDADGNQLTKTDQLGNTISYTYDGKGNILTQTDANGNVTSYTYNGNGEVAMITSPQGNVTNYTYNGEQKIVKVSDIKGVIVKYSYDAKGNKASSTDAQGNVTSYTYDSAGNLLTVSKPGGGVTTFTYDKDNQIKLRTEANGNTKSYEYDVNNQLTSETDDSGNKTSFAYNAAGDWVSRTDALGNQTFYSYDVYGNLNSSTDSNGNVTNYMYNENNKLVCVIDPLGNSTSYSYNLLGELEKATDANGNVTSYTNDASGRAISVTNTLGNTKQFVYDANGNVIKTIDALGNETNYSFNSENLQTSVTDVLQNTVQNAYNARGNLISTTDASGSKTEYTYDLNNRIISSTDALGVITSQTYDADGNITSVTNPLGGSTSYWYDQAGLLTAETTTSGGTISYGYNAQNLKETITNARGQTRSYTYDALGRITGYTSPEGNAQFTYDNNSNVLTATDSNGTITREYDALNRVTKYTNTQGEIIQYEYDPVGNLVKMTYPDNTAVVYTYDANNNLKTVTDWANRVTTYTYDANDNLVGVVKPDGSVTVTQYDSAQRVVSTVERTANGVVITGYEYTYDELGRIVTEISLADNKKYEMEYDNLSRVTIRKETNLTMNETKEENYSYDDSGNIISFVVSDTENTMVYDANNRLISYNGHEITYDSDGNMISGFIGNDAISLMYDSGNRLVNAGGSQYTYDVENNRITSLYSTNQKSYTYDTTSSLSRLLVTEDQLGNMTKYVYGLGLIRQEDTSGFKTYHYDYRGSTAVITDEYGNVIDTFEYDTYGKLTARTGNTDTPFQYNGRDGAMTDENGLLYMRARYYSPELKRFVNADVFQGNLNNHQTLNRYAYANGNPVSNIDPFGLAAESGSNFPTIGFDWGRLGGQYFVGDTTFQGMANSDTLEAAKQAMDGAIITSTRPNNIGAGTWAKQVTSDLKWSDDVLGASSVLGKSMKAVPYASLALETGIGIYENINEGESAQRVVSDAAVDVGVGLSGIWVSALVGGAVGSLIPVPIVGTLVGVGAGLVAGIGYYIVTDIITFNGKSVVEWAKEGAGWAGNQISNGWNSFTSWLGF